MVDRIFLGFGTLKHLQDLLDLSVLFNLMTVLSTSRSHWHGLLLMTLWHTENVLVTLNNLRTLSIEFAQRRRVIEQEAGLHLFEARIHGVDSCLASNSRCCRLTDVQ